MNKRLIIFALLFLVPILLLAGEIYGNLTYKNGSPVPYRIIDFESSTTKDHKIVKTDKYGTYRCFLKEGKWKLSVRGAKDIVTVYSGKKPARYDLVIIKTKTGYVLRRR